MSNAATADMREQVLAGALLSIAAYFLFSLHDAVIKLLVAGISVWQVLFFRSVVVLAGCAMLGGPTLLVDAARSPIVRPMLLRAVLTLSAWICFYTAAKHLQLAELTTIYFGAPVFVTVLSIFILGERVPPLRWAGVLVGFVGVFIACRPTELGLSPPILMVLAASVLWALALVYIRKIALAERTSIQVVLNNAFFLVFAGVPMLFVWETPSLPGFLMLSAVGSLGGIAQFLLFESMKRAPASVTATCEYTALIWAFLLGFAIWGDKPRPEVYAGAVLIVTAGLLVVAGERLRRAA